ncbi:MAG: RNA polymerase sigma factor [Cryomorphaceae bacterium]|nr:sigma-70 family RNA polymerase sigma factor [Flavobacteriales bacterium]
MSSPHKQTPKYLEGLDDKALWGAFRGGDREAFGVIYRAQLNSLFNYGMKVIADRNLVKDAIQELFIELWKGRERLSDTDQIKYYLYKAFRRKLIRDALAERKYCGDNTSGVTADEIVFSKEHSMISEEISQQRKAVLQKALSRISMRQQEVINLLYFENYSYEQVSQIMGINVKSVYTIAWKAASALRKALKSV